MKLGDGVTKTIDDVKIRMKNNINNYKASQVEDKTTTSVVVFGTQENVDKITAADINVYVDMAEAKPGLMEFPLQVDQPSDGMVRYTLTDATYTMNVLGETTEDTDDSSGTEVNNG